MEITEAAKGWKRGGDIGVEGGAAGEALQGGITPLSYPQYKGQEGQSGSMLLAWLLLEALSFSIDAKTLATNPPAQLAYPEQAAEAAPDQSLHRLLPGYRWLEYHTITESKSLESSSK